MNGSARSICGGSFGLDGEQQLARHQVAAFVLDEELHGQRGFGKRDLLRRVGEREGLVAREPAGLRGSLDPCAADGLPIDHEVDLRTQHQRIVGNRALDADRHTDRGLRLAVGAGDRAAQRDHRRLVADDVGQQRRTVHQPAVAIGGLGAEDDVGTRPSRWRRVEHRPDRHLEELARLLHAAHVGRLAGRADRHVVDVEADLLEVRAEQLVLPPVAAGHPDRVAHLLDEVRARLRPLEDDRERARGRLANDEDREQRWLGGGLEEVDRHRGDLQGAPGVGWRLDAQLVRLSFPGGDRDAVDRELDLLHRLIVPREGDDLDRLARGDRGGTAQDDSWPAVSHLDLGAVRLPGVHGLDQGLAQGFATHPPVAVDRGNRRGPASPDGPQGRRGQVDPALAVSRLRACRRAEGIDDPGGQAKLEHRADAVDDDRIGLDRLPGRTRNRRGEDAEVFEHTAGLHQHRHVQPSLPEQLHVHGCLTIDRPRGQHAAGRDGDDGRVGARQLDVRVAAAQVRLVLGPVGIGVRRAEAPRHPKRDLLSEAREVHGIGGDGQAQELVELPFAGESHLGGVDRPPVRVRERDVRGHHHLAAHLGEWDGQGHGEAQHAG